jgi:hypothetical protein
MPITNPPQEEMILHRAPEPDPGTSFRTTAASMGLILIGVGVLMSAYMFWQLARVLLDPRPLVEQVNRWEFVIRGRANDIPVRPIERGDEEKLRRQPQLIGNPTANETNPLTPGQGATQGTREVEAVAEFAKRMGSLGARPAALLLMLVLLSIMVRIAIGFIEAGGKLVNLAAGEKEFMQRLLKEITGRSGR